ncbi:hypothetical protein ACLKA7_014438 [Drosophila subpalustris]
MPTQAETGEWGQQTGLELELCLKSMLCSEATAKNRVASFGQVFGLMEMSKAQCQLRDQSRQEANIWLDFWLLCTTLRILISFRVRSNTNDRFSHWELGTWNLDTGK